MFVAVAVQGVTWTELFRLWQTLEQNLELKATESARIRI